MARRLCASVRRALCLAAVLTTAVVVPLASGQTRATGQTTNHATGQATSRATGRATDQASATGLLRIPALTAGTIAVCRASARRCNGPSDAGWAGELTTQLNELPLPVARYRLRIGQQLSEPITITADQPLDYPLATLGISNLDRAAIAICSAQSTHCAEPLGWLTPQQASTHLLPGQYRLKHANHYSSVFKLKSGETLDAPLGLLSLSALTHSEVDVCGSESALCADQTSADWVGTLTPLNADIEVIPGVYWLRIGRYQSAPVRIRAFETLDIPLATITVYNIPERIRLAVCANHSECRDPTSAGWLGSIDSRQRTIEVLAGRYQLRNLSNGKTASNLIVHADDQLLLEY